MRLHRRLFSNRCDATLSAFSHSPAPPPCLPRSNDARYGGVSLSGSDYHPPIQPPRAVGHDHRPSLPVIREAPSFSFGRLPSWLTKQKQKPKKRGGGGEGEAAPSPRLRILCLCWAAQSWSCSVSTSTCERRRVSSSRFFVSDEPNTTKSHLTEPHTGVPFALISPQGALLSPARICVARILFLFARLGVSPPPSLVPCISVLALLLPLPQDPFPGGQFSCGPLKRACFVLDTEGKRRASLANRKTTRPPAKEAPSGRRTPTFPSRLSTAAPRA
ncbi:hypothetical protein J3F83DRAFT_65616 [Trichoderma novae-zelandiae]